MKIKTKAKINFNTGVVDSINDIVSASIININTDLKTYNILAELYSENKGVVTKLGQISASVNSQTYSDYLNKFTSDKQDKYEAQVQTYYYVLLEEAAKFLKITVADLEIVDGGIAIK